jgi:thiamine biosynthesis protein ThiS
MRLTVNGEAKECPGVATVADLVRTLGLDRAPCAVEVNAALVPKAKHAAHALHDDDRVEIVTLVGGG